MVWSTPANAISIKEEQELAREFMKVVARRFQLIDDPLLVNYVNKVGQRILSAVPPQPFTFHFYIIKEDVYNAFAIPAGHIFINSGLLAALDNEDELAGLLAHEIAHVVCRHISRNIDRSKKISLATMAGVVAGIFLGAAGGDPAAMQALTVGSAAAGQTATLAYSRQDEAQADQLGLEFLTKAGYSGKGLLLTLKKIRTKQWFGSQQVPTYMMTHPGLENRIASIDTWMAVSKNPAPPLAYPNGSALFRKINVRLKALYEDPDTALQTFETALAHNPNDINMEYGFGLVLARMGKRKEAVGYLKQALAHEALDPVILSDLGRVYFLDGRYEEALNILEGAVSVSKVNPEGLFYLGRTRMELGQIAAAAQAFEKMLEIYADYQPAYQFLGEAYGRLGRMPDSHYYLGLSNYRKGDFRTARYHLLRAQKGINDPEKLETIKETLKYIGRLPNESGQH